VTDKVNDTCTKFCDLSEHLASYDVRVGKDRQNPTQTITFAHEIVKSYTGKGEVVEKFT
jgi:hypothetical protein